VILVIRMISSSIYDMDGFLMVGDTIHHSSADGGIDVGPGSITVELSSSTSALPDSATGRSFSPPARPQTSRKIHCAQAFGGKSLVLAVVADEMLAVAIIG
jgi:hypothetical protein